MKTFKKRGVHDRPAINTASLPDIIFILLFFFMVVTVLRKSKLLVDFQLPPATELDKLEKKSLINHIYIGSPRDKRFGDAPKIQINDAFIKINQVREAIKHLEQSVPDFLLPKIINSMKVDEKVTMGIVTDVKTELRKANRLKINYAAVPRKK